MSLPPAAVNAARLWLRTVTAELPFPSRKKPLDYHSITDTTESLPDLRAKILSIKPVSSSADHVQLTLEVPAGVKHRLPGQFVTLARVSRKPISCIAVIASPPGAERLDFLLAKGADPAKLLSAKLGETLAISPVKGDGLEYDHLANSNGDLFAFADSPQGFAAIKSMIEWPKFRAITGEGANRINHVTVYYSLPGQRSVPYADRFSSWSVYGVNVVPLMGSSLTEYLSANAAVGRPKKNLAADFAVACVATEETFEALFCTLVLCGFRRKAIQKFSALDVMLQSNDDYEESEDVRESFEHEVWASWVEVREGMRRDFENKWAAQGRHERHEAKKRKDKEQAWASWSAKNKDQWTRVHWDDQAWGRYWSSWEDTNQRWAGDKTSSWKREADETRKRWSQQSSQEYWDWVGRGTQRERSGGGGGGGYSSERSYSEQYGASGGYGNANNRWSGWEKGGYKYQYEEPKEKKTHKQNYQDTGAGGGGGWSGWNRGSGKRTSSGNTRNWSSVGKQEIDFYGVLGINSGASRSEIKKAYRKMAMRHHPDRNPDNVQEAHVRMKQIVVAWTVLKDDAKRRQYDAFGSNGL